MNRAAVADDARNVYASQMDLGPYPGAVPVGLSGATTASQKLTAGAVPEVSMDVAQARQFADTAATGINTVASEANQQNQWNQYQNMQVANNLDAGLNAMDVQNNPYLAQAMQAAIRPITESYTDAGGVMSGIRTNAANAGQYGGSRQGVAEGIAADRYMEQVGDTMAKMGSDAYNKGMDTYTKTLAVIPDWQKASQGNLTANAAALQGTSQAANVQADAAKTNAQTYQDAVNALSGVGAQQENYQQQIADYYANARLWDINSQWLPLQNYANIVYGNSGAGTSTASASSAPRTSIGQAAGTAVNAGMLASMFM
jgi:hypothetical protein